MKTIYMAEVKNADNMTKSAKNVLNYINGKYYAVGNKDDEGEYCTIWDNCGRGWLVGSDTLVKLPIDEEIIGTCGDCRHWDKWEYCGNEDSPCNHLGFNIDEDFGCNKWESK